MANLLVICKMTKDGVGVEGLTDVVVDIDSFNLETMTRAEVTQTPQPAIEARNGRYFYWVQDADLALWYTADFMTAGDVDRKDMAALVWDAAYAHIAELAFLDRASSSAPLGSDYTPERAALLDYLDRNISDGPLGSDYTPARAAKLDFLTSASEVILTAPVAVGGSVETYIGDDYYNADGRALGWSSEDWPDLTGAAVIVKINRVATFNAVVVGAHEIRLELSTADTAKIYRADHSFQIKATLSNGHKITLVDAIWSSKAQPENAS